jgi:hypothetical protein
MLRQQNELPMSMNTNRRPSEGVRAATLLADPANPALNRPSFEGPDCLAPSAAGVTGP